MDVITPVDYTQKVPVPPTLWYEDKDGNRWIPSAEDLPNVTDPPLGFDFQYSQFPCYLEETVLKLVRSEEGRIERSVDLMTGHFGWSEDLVLAMAVSGKYRLSEAILVVARSCERCVNALAHAYGLDGGYAPDSENYRTCRTSCETCQ